jgi:intracellular sulfur oxidation DsrE/DsrF family protein
VVDIETVSVPGTAFHLPGRATEYADRVFRNATNLCDDETAAGEVVVVCNSADVTHVLDPSTADPAVSKVLDRGATVVACRNSLESRDADAADLLEGVTVVPTAMRELTRRQAQG